LEVQRRLLLSLLGGLLSRLLIALLAALTGVLRLLAGLVGLVALLAALVLVGTCHDETPLVITNVMITAPDAVTFRVPRLFSFFFAGQLI
jgi:hypothetical protein